MVSEPCQLCLIFCHNTNIHFENIFFLQFLLFYFLVKNPSGGLSRKMNTPGISKTQRAGIDLDLGQTPKHRPTKHVHILCIILERRTCMGELDQQVFNPKHGIDVS